MEVLGFSEYSSFGNAIIKLYQIEGIRGFFTGLGISLIRDVPFSGVFFPIYEVTKHLLGILLRFDNNN